jgi:hypothetical protein
VGDFGQGVAHLDRRGEPPRGLLLEAAAQDGVDLRRDELVLLVGARRRVAEDRRNHLGGRLAAERTAAGRHLVEHHAEREEIGAGIGRQHAQLFGRHVGKGADRQSLLGEGGLGMEAHGVGGLVLAELGETEVEDLHPAVAVDHDVAGFEIAMLDPLGVRRSQGIGERHGDPQEFPERHAPRRDDLRESLAFDVLHGEEALAVGLFDRVDGDDVRVVEGRDGLHLALEARETLRILGEGRRQGFERDLAMQALVLGEEDDPHAALAQLLEDPIVRKPAADHTAESIVSNSFARQCYRRNATLLLPALSPL